ncbi:hypothetical protein EPO04_00315 [Patescibacteria group bacterium]|nr:MAG: hypothetical protein EPO04_00315 [Patescibacteria group bacterium]
MTPEQRQPSDDTLKPEANAELLAKVESQFADEREKDNPLYKWLLSKERPVTDELEEGLPEIVQSYLRFLRETTENSDIARLKSQLKLRPDNRVNKEGAFGSKSPLRPLIGGLSESMDKMGYRDQVSLLADARLRGELTAAYEVAAHIIRTEAADDPEAKHPTVVSNPLSDTQFMHEAARYVMAEQKKNNIS